MANLADKIKDKSLTVREAVDNAGVSLVTKGGEPTALAKNIEAAGLSLDAPWDDIKSNFSTDHSSGFFVGPDEKFGEFGFGN